MGNNDLIQNENERLAILIKERTEELSASKDYLEKIINTVASPIFVKDNEHKFCLVNNAFCSLLGLSEEEIIGSTGYENFPKDQMEVFIAKDRTVFDTGKENINEEFLTDGNGKIRTIITKKALYTNPSGNKFLVGIINDITEQKKADKDLRNSEERFKTLIENSSDVISILDDKGIITYESPSHEKVLGYESGKLIGENVFGLVHPDDRERISMQFVKLLKNSNGVEQVNFRFLHNDGTWIYIEGTGTNLLKSSLVKGIVVNYRDITERKKGEESLRASEERFRKAITLAPYPIMIHSEGKVLQLSKEWSNQTGYTIDDIPTIKEWTLKAYGKDAVPSQEFINNLYKIDKTQYDGEWKVKIKDGSYRIWDFSSSPIGESENGNRMAMSMASDITERNQKHRNKY
jgi:PAS domain S-box-containing protein